MHAEPEGARQSQNLKDAFIRTQLERMLACDTFVRSERLSAFLRFIVEETLAGRGDGLKEQVIAAEVYGKRLGSEPTDSSTVRVDARRLRDRLREYYAEHGSDPVIVSLQKGSYRPSFESNPEASSPAIFPLPVPVPRPAKRTLPMLAALGVIVVLGTATLMWTWRNGNKPAAWEAVPLTSLPGMEGPPSLSPDGNFVAFPWNGGVERGSFDIWIKAVGSEARRRLTETPASELSPAWSPDGREIAFVRGGAGVFVVSQLGGPERKISASGTHVAWVPDGKSVLIRDRVNEGPVGIFEISLDSLKRRQITQPVSGTGDWRFDVSPDGNTLAFIRYQREGAADIYVVPMSGGEPERRTDLGAEMGGLAWAPDGSDIIFSYAFSSVPRLARIPARGTFPAASSPVLLAVNAHYPAIARGRPGHPSRLAFVAIFIDHSLSLIDLDRDGNSGLVHDVKSLFDASRPDYLGSFSPDGSKVAFTSDRSGSNQLWIGNRDGSGLRQLTSLRSPGVQWPSWSPDGRQIAFEASIAGNTDLYVIGEDGGAVERLTREAAVDAEPFWSRDGRWIYFTSDRTGRREIWKLPPAGGSAIQITHQGGSEPAEAADGKSLYFVRRGVLKAIPVDGGGESEVLPAVRDHGWAVSGRGIFFLSTAGNRDSLALYDSGSREARRLFELPFRIAWNGDIGRLAASRDGRWLLATRHERFDADLMFVDNFR